MPNIKIDQKIKGNFKITTVKTEDIVSDFVHNITTPAAILMRKDLPANAKHIYGLLYTINTKQHPEYGTNRFIANSLGIRPRSVQRLLEILVQKSLISKVFNGGGKLYNRSYMRVVEENLWGVRQ